MKKNIFFTGITISLSFIFMIFLLFNNQKREPSQSPKRKADYLEKYVYTEKDREIISKQDEMLSVDTSENNCYIMKNFEEMQDRADVIIIARPKNHFLEDKHLEFKFFDREKGTETIIDHATISPVKIEKVLKGGEHLNDKDLIYVSQNGLYSNKEKILSNGNLPVQKGKDYIFFLNLPKEGYDLSIYPKGEITLGIMGCYNEGKVLIEKGYKSPREGTFAGNALKKYEKEIEELMDVPYEEEALETKKEEVPPVISSAEATVASSETN